MKINKLAKWWLSPKFPDTHIKMIGKYKPVGFRRFARDRVRTWFLHPVKRRVAKYYLKFLQNFLGLKVIGITGSAGKTTTKEMLASILKLQGNTVFSYANIDPIYNIPTTILRCRPSTRFLVLEMGVEYRKEMDFYCWLAKPDIGIITNIFPTHTKYLGGIFGVYREKIKLAKAVTKTGSVILNAENMMLAKLDRKLRAKIIWYGKNSGIRSINEKLTPGFKTNFQLIFNNGRKEIVEITLPILGYQFIENALASAACAYSLNISSSKIKRGLENFKVQEHRMNVIKHPSGALILDDSYNSNLEAAKRAVQTLVGLPYKNKIAVLGDMLELGKLEHQSHIDLGRYVANLPIAKLICVGEASKFTAKEAKRIIGADRVVVCKNWQLAVDEVNKCLDKKSAILVKGSRSIGLDNLIKEIGKNT